MHQLVISFRIQLFYSFTDCVINILCLYVYKERCLLCLLILLIVLVAFVVVFCKSDSYLAGKELGIRGVDFYGVL